MTGQALRREADVPHGLQWAIWSNAELQKSLSQKVFILVCAVWNAATRVAL